MKLNLTTGAEHDIPTVDEIEQELKTAPNLEVMNERIHEVIQILTDFNNRRQPNRTRQEYLTILLKNLCSKYNYNEFLMEKFMQLFPNSGEVSSFFYKKMTTWKGWFFGFTTFLYMPINAE